MFRFIIFYQTPLIRLTVLSVFMWPTPSCGQTNANIYLLFVVESYLLANTISFIIMMYMTIVSQFRKIGESDRINGEKNIENSCHWSRSSWIVLHKACPRQWTRCNCLRTEFRSRWHMDLYR